MLRTDCSGSSPPALSIDMPCTHSCMLYRVHRPVLTAERDNFSQRTPPTEDLPTVPVRSPRWCYGSAIKLRFAISLVKIGLRLRTSSSSRHTIPPKAQPCQQQRSIPLPRTRHPTPSPPTILTSWLNILAWLFAPCDASGLKICCPYIEAGGISTDSHTYLLPCSYVQLWLRVFMLSGYAYAPERPRSRWARVQREFGHGRIENAPCWGGGWDC